MFKIESTRVAATIESPEWVIIPKEWGWNISKYEEFFISLRDNENQIPATRKLCEAARMLLKWAGTCRAELESFATRKPNGPFEFNYESLMVERAPDLWVFNFEFNSTKDAAEFLQYVEEYVSDSINYY